MAKVKAGAFDCGDHPWRFRQKDGGQVAPSPPHMRRGLRGGAEAADLKLSDCSKQSDTLFHEHHPF